MRSKRWIALMAVVWGLSSIFGCGPAEPQPANSQPAVGSNSSSSSNAVGFVVTAEQVTDAKLRDWKRDQSTIALKIDSARNHESDLAAATAIRSAGLQLDYFIEVARCPEMADSHPEWMASLQGHPEWRQTFPDVPQPNDGQVIKNYPWVPIMYRESFDAHLDRISTLLSGKPQAGRIWLNDLQAAPSACGCGHPLCRWTADYGPIKTATPLGPSAAADFVTRVERQFPGCEVVPVFVGECEREDKDSVCCGVACFEGKCWVEFANQLDALSATSPRIGVACFYKQFDRDLPRYAQPAGWVGFTLDSFTSMPPQRGGVGVPASRLIAVLQGWDVAAEELDAQIKQVQQSEVSGFLIVQCPIDQSWQPVVFDLPQASPLPK